MLQCHSAPSNFHDSKSYVIQTQELMHAEYEQQNSLLFQITAKESKLQVSIYVQCRVPVIQNTIHHHHHQGVTS